MRILAQRTQESTTEIERIIEQLQSGAGSAVELVERGQACAQATAGQATQAGEARQGIQLAIHELSIQGQVLRQLVSVFRS